MNIAGLPFTAAHATSPGRQTLRNAVPASVSRSKHGCVAGAPPVSADANSADGPSAGVTASANRAGIKKSMKAIRFGALTHRGSR